MMTNTWADVWELRTSLYSFFAKSLLEPMTEDDKEVLTETFWSEFPLESANAQMTAGLEQLNHCSSKLAKLSQEKALEEVMVEYTSLFIGPGVPAAPPYESFYHSDRRLIFGQPTVEMKEVLSKHGLESKKKDKQPEDHIGLELMILSVMTEQLKELKVDQQVSNIKEQISFIDKHLLSWISELCQDAKANRTIGFYGAFIELIWGVLLLDKELLTEFVEENERLSVNQ